MTEEKKGKNMSLFNIAESFSAVENLIAISDGEITPAVEQALDAVEDAEEKKVESICSLIKMHEAFGKTARDEGQRVGKLARSRESTVKSLKGYLVSYMKARKRSRLDGGRYAVALVDGPYSVVVHPEADTVRMARSKVQRRLLKDPPPPPKPVVNTDAVKRVFQGRVAYWTAKLLKDTYYRKMMAQHGVMSKSLMAVELANMDLPAGINVVQNEHIRIR